MFVEILEKMAHKKPWEDNWIKKDILGKGGQGLTYCAKRKPEDGRFYVLKILKEQKDIERRERMSIEVAALRTLEHSNIQKFIDSNAHNFKSLDEELYLITEYIPGPTLQEFIKSNGLLTLNYALSLTIKICDILGFCHRKGIYHRDIKPDNIIIRDRDLKNPTLIDFGLSFNQEYSNEKNSTPSWQHIGNRFLSLPELRVSEGNKRDPRSDITMLCGILFFCLTGIQPTDLMDENQNKPHRRDKAKQILQKLDKDKISGINRIFDIGFYLGINNRWQSVESLMSALNDLLNLKAVDLEELDVNKKLQNFKERIEERLDFKQSQEIQLIFQNIDNTIENACREVMRELKPIQFVKIQTGHNINYSSQLFTNQIGIRHPFSEKIFFYPKFTCFINGSEIVLEGNEDGTVAELFRYPLNEEIDWLYLENKIREYYINGLSNKEE